jgi:putative hydrolase
MIDAGELVHRDAHVHSTFSDGAASLAENIAEAERIGLRALTCVDHVRLESDWVPSFADAVSSLRGETSLELRCAVEAKLLDTTGALDLPGGLDGIDCVYIADHQVPMPGGPRSPREIRALIEAGELDPRVLMCSLITATAMSLRCPHQVLIAHLFSVLPKLGLSKDGVPEQLIEALAAAAQANGAWIEINERWRCPTARTLRPFLRRGVPLLLGTDSHQTQTLGRFDYCEAVLHELAAVPLTPA